MTAAICSFIFSLNPFVFASLSAYHFNCKLSVAELIGLANENAKINIKFG